jgi:hypothetical protein
MRDKVKEQVVLNDSMTDLRKVWCIIPLHKKIIENTVRRHLPVHIDTRDACQETYLAILSLPAEVMAEAIKGDSGRFISFLAGAVANHWNRSEFKGHFIGVTGISARTYLEELKRAELSFKDRGDYQREAQIKKSTQQREES